MFINKFILACMYKCHGIVNDKLLHFVNCKKDKGFLNIIIIPCTDYTITSSVLPKIPKKHSLFLCIL